jgi:uncharacterized protein YjbI with pentapeptide repeats
LTRALRERKVPIVPKIVQKVVAGERFRAAEAEALDFANTRFEDCTFDHCALQGRELRRARFLDCVFDTCDLAVAKVPDCTFARVKLKNCRLSGINWSMTEKLESVSFEDCQMRDATFIGVRLDDCTLERCIAHGATFREASLVKASFRDSELVRAEFVNCDLRGADFRGAIGYAISVTENRLQNARFSLPEAVSLLKGLGILLE